MRTRWTVCLLVLLAVTFCVSLVDVAAQGQPAPPGYHERHGPASIPAGAAVTVRTDKQIEIGTAQPGDIFPATLDEDIVQSGKVLVRRGAPAEIRLTKVREDQDELAFKLYTLTIDGKKFRVVSDTARERARKEAPKQESGVAGLEKNLLGQALGTSGGGLSWSGAQRQDAKVPAGTFLEFTLREQVNLEK